MSNIHVNIGVLTCSN